MTHIDAPSRAPRPAAARRTASADAGLNRDGYILSRTEAEAARLRAQSQAIEPLTLRVLERAGLAPGMRCLDVGCGTGAVTRLLGRAVGPGGQVTGFDVDAATGARMLEELRAEHKSGPAYAFVAGDIMSAGTIAEGSFDLVFARLLLIHMIDPVEALRRLAVQARPGGRIVLVDYDLSHLAARPEDPTIDRGFEIVTACFERSGKRADAGLRLGQWLREAGLPAAEGYECQPIFGDFVQVGWMLDAVLESLAPAAKALGVAPPEEVAAIRAAVRAALLPGQRTGMGPIVIGAWTTKPG